MKKLSIDNFTADKVSIVGNKFTFAKGSGRITLPLDCTDGKYIAMDITNERDISAVLTWRFMSEDGRFIGFRMGLLPYLRTRIALPYSALDGKILFLPRTPGKLKTVTQGRPIPLEDVSTLLIESGNSYSETEFTIHDLFVTDEEPDYPLPDMKMVDELGQKLCTEWEGKTKSTNELKAFVAKEYAEILDIQPENDVRSRFGGWKGKKFNATGFFRLENDGRRWWMVDPDGYAFFSMGLDCVRVDGDCNLNGIAKLCEYLPPKGSVGWKEGEDALFSFHKHNLYTAFGEEWFEKFCNLTRSRMIKWGFNTVACWSDMDFARNAKIPYTYIFSGRPLTKARVFRDFPDVFSKEYEEVCKEWAKQIIDFADDQYLLGYFLGNEPQWAFVNDLNLAALLLESGKEMESYKVLIKFLTDKYGDISSLNSAWGTSFADFDSISNPNNTAADADLWSFTAEMIREYMRVPSEAIRVHDKNHLNLGIRYAWLSSEVLASGSEYVDVFSFNCYQMDPTGALDSFYSKVKKPLMIGEFHFGALDVGLDATGLRGVTSQHERGVAYRRYMQAAAAHPMCLGAHYFTLNDQAYLGRYDGENYQIGIIDCCQRPYKDFVKGIELAHSELYEIADGKREPDAPMAKEISMIAF